MQTSAVQCSTVVEEGKKKREKGTERKEKSSESVSVIQGPSSCKQWMSIWWQKLKIESKGYDTVSCPLKSHFPLKFPSYSSTHSYSLISLLLSSLLISLHLHLFYLTSIWYSVVCDAMCCKNMILILEKQSRAKHSKAKRVIEKVVLFYSNLVMKLLFSKIAVFRKNAISYRWTWLSRI